LTSGTAERLRNEVKGYVTDLARSSGRCRPLLNGSILTLLNFIKLSAKFESRWKSFLLELLTEFKVDFRLLGTVTCRPVDRQYLI